MLHLYVPLSFVHSFKITLGRLIAELYMIQIVKKQLLQFLCLRTEGAGGIMFPGCPSVRPDFRPDLCPDFFVYAITQVLLDGISSNLVQGCTTRSR